LGQARSETVLCDDRKRIGATSGIRDSRARSESGLLANRNVADRERENGGRASRLREASALNGGDVFADGVDFVDAGAASDQRPVELPNVSKRKRSE